MRARREGDQIHGTMDVAHLYAPADDVGEARQRPDRRRAEARVGHLSQRGEVVQPRARPRHQVPLAPRPRAARTDARASVIS